MKYDVKEKIQVKLALDASGLQERKALEQFYSAVRKATPQVRALAERYGGDVAFSFDSNGRSVWGRWRSSGRARLRR